MIEQSVIHLLLGLSIGVTLSYALAFRKGAEQYAAIGRTLMLLLAGGLVVCSAMLVINLVQHQFQFTYVFRQSSREMPLHLLIASFYSGQEGSFLLWAMFVALIAVVVTPYARRRQYEHESMMLFGIILTFLTLLLVAKNPFAYYWESFAESGITQADVPLNGRGMNPLLHNVWITIHPPILFMGFASMTVSFVFSMTGLIKREYHRWIDVALPWTLFATVVLGFGIMLGGFWAYETLGWGGFWGWDPVENSSLIPWLVSVALVHTMLVQKRTKGLVKTNIILAILAFVLVLYSTFLTRSGVLGDTSVHSFVDPGAFAFWILLVFMATFFALGVGAVLYRARDINASREEFAASSREFFLSIGSALIMASAIFVTVGTSWPVIMEILTLPKVAVSTDFYNLVHLFLVPAVMLVNGLSLYTQWRSTTMERFRKRTLTAALVAVPFTVAGIFLGITAIGMIALLFSALFALIVNVQIGWTVVRRGISNAGAYISHTGIALLVLGVVSISNFTVMHHAVLIEGEPVSVGGYTLTFKGREQIEKQWTDREKFRYYVDVQPDQQPGAKPVTLAATLYWSDYNNRESAFLEPGIRWGISNDLYLTPKATNTEDVYKSVELKKTDQIVMPYDSSVSLSLEGFVMPTPVGADAEGGIQLGASVRVNETDTLTLLTTITTGQQGMVFQPEWTTIQGTRYQVGLMRVTRNNDNPDASTAVLGFRDSAAQPKKPREIFVVDFSVKPWISLVWVGVITMVLGFGFSIAKYIRKQGRTEQPSI